MVVSIGFKLDPLQWGIKVFVSGALFLKKGLFKGVAMDFSATSF